MPGAGVEEEVTLLEDHHLRREDFAPAGEMLSVERFEGTLPALIRVIRGHALVYISVARVGIEPTTFRV